jgi:hypothetical protein
VFLWRPKKEFSLVQMQAKFMVTGVELGQTKQPIHEEHIVDYKPCLQSVIYCIIVFT